jgi:hypothetical protein
MRYNLKLNKISYLFLALIMVVSFTSCEVESEPDNNNLGNDELRGTWIVSEYNGADISELWYGPYALVIHNTSSDQNSIWVDNIYDSGIKVKAGVTSETTFGVTDADDNNGAWSGTIDISEARVINKDSIVFKVIMYDSNGDVYDDFYEAGHRFNGHNYDH